MGATAYGTPARSPVEGGGSSGFYARAVLLDYALRATFRNFSTLFLVVAVVTVPLHVAHSFVYRRVIAVEELHSDIETFPAERQVRSVGREQLADARTAFWVVTALEVLLLPLLAAATGRVLESDARHRLPGVVDAFAHPRFGTVRAPRAGAAWAVPGAVAIAVAAWLLLERTGLIVVEPLPDVAAWAGVGVVLGVSRACAIPFVLVTTVITLRTKTATGGSLGKGP